MQIRLTKRLARDFEPAIKAGRLPAFCCWFAFLGGTACAYLLAFQWPFKLYHFLIGPAIAAVAVLLMIVSRHHFRLIPAFFAGSILLLLRFETEADFFSTRGLPRDISESVLYGRTAGYTHRTSSGFLLGIQVDSASFSSGPIVLFKGKKVVCRSREYIPTNSEVILSGRFRRPRPRMNPGGFDEYNYLLSRGVYGNFYSDGMIEARSLSPSISTGFLSRIREYVDRQIDRIPSPMHRAIFSAVILADRYGLPTFTKESYRYAGTIHLLAISGLHVGILAAFTFFVLSLFPVPPSVRSVTVMLFLFGYLLLVGPAPSIFRATMMTCIILLATAFRRKYRILNAVGLAGIIWLIISPRSLFTPGYQLTFSATLGIVMLFPIFSSVLPRSTGTLSWTLVFRSIAGLFFVSLAGFLSTAPILMYHFREISLLGLITNIWTVSSMTGAMLLFFVGLLLSTVSTALSGFAFLVSRFFFSLVTATADYSRLFPGGTILSAVPSAVSMILFVFALILPAVVMPKQRLIYGGFSLMFFLMVYPTATVLDLKRDRTEACLFSLREGHAAGIRVSRHRIWLILSCHETMYNRPSRDALLPWLGTFPGGQLEGIVVPAPSINLVHDLKLLLRTYRVKRIVTGALPNDKLFREDLDTFLMEHGTLLEELVHGGLIHLCDSTRIELFPTIDNGIQNIGLRAVPQWSATINGTHISYPRPPKKTHNREGVVLCDGKAQLIGNGSFPWRDSLSQVVDLRELGALTMISSDTEGIGWTVEAEHRRPLLRMH